MTALTCDRADLAWALKAVLPHAGRDMVLPSLCGVRVEVVPAENVIYFIATDRYTLGVATIPTEGEHDPIEVTLPLLEVRDLLRKLPGAERLKGDARRLPLDVMADCVLFDSFYKFRVLADIWVGQAEPATFVKWRPLLADALRNQPCVPGRDLGYEAAYLARFATAGRGSKGVTVMPVRARQNGGQSGGMTIVLADNFAGVAMGRKYEDNEVRLRRWRELIPAGGKK